MSNCDPPFDSSSSSCSSSPPASSLKGDHQHENDSGCASDDDPTLALKISKGLSMGYDYELIKSVIDQQSHGEDMSKFIETMVRTAEMQAHSASSPRTSPTTVNPKSTTSDTDSDSNVVHDVYMIDGADLAYTLNQTAYSWRPIELCLKSLHSHGHKKVFVALPYALKHHRHDAHFLESKILRDLERKNLLVYTNRQSKQSNKSASFTHISEMLKFSQKTKGLLITNVTLKDVLLDFTIYKQILEERIIRYRFQQDTFQPLLVTIVTGDDGNDYETYSPLCPYGKKCTYGSKCKYFHMERRQSATNSMLQTKSSPEHLHMYSSPTSHEQSLADDARLVYEYGLASTPMTNEFSFVDQRLPPQWFGTTPSFVPRTMSMPQPIVPNDLFMMQQQQQYWLRQQFDQNALRYFSMLPMQQQQFSQKNIFFAPAPPESHYDEPSVNSQQGLADRIQSVRHLWESEPIDRLNYASPNTAHCFH